MDKQRSERVSELYEIINSADNPEVCLTRLEALSEQSVKTKDVHQTAIDTFTRICSDKFEHSDAGISVIVEAIDTNAAPEKNWKKIIEQVTKLQQIPQMDFSSPIHSKTHTKPFHDLCLLVTNNQDPAAFIKAAKAPEISPSTQPLSYGPGQK